MTCWMLTHLSRHMNDFNPINALLETVDKLTVGHTSAIWQEFEDGRRASTVRVPALIGLLRESIHSSTSGSGGGALASQRNMLDSDAVEKLDKITSEISTLYRSTTSASLFSTPEQNLRQWFIAVQNNHRQGKMSDDAVIDALQHWSNWVRVIEDKLFPPTTLEVMSPCPVCDSEWARVSDGETVHAIIIEYRKPSDERINALAKSVAKCRSCGTAWRGDRRLRELAFAIDEKQHAETNVSSANVSGVSVTLLSAGNSCAQMTEMGQR